MQPYRLFVDHLPAEISEPSLRELFAGDGRGVVSVVIAASVAGRAPMSAFVEMACLADAIHAMLALDGRELGGRRLRVVEARPRSMKMAR